jgi:hypothetical protein
MHLDRQKLLLIERRCPGKNHDTPLVRPRNVPLRRTAPQGTPPLFPTEALVEGDALGFEAGDIPVVNDRREMPHDGAADALPLVGQ